MKRNVFASLFLAALFALTACGDKDKDKDTAADDTAGTAGEPKATEGDPAAPAGDVKPTEGDTAAAGGTVTAEDEKMAEAALAYFDDLGTAAAAAGDDCDKMAAAITETAGKHKASELFTKMNELDKDPAKSKALEEKYAPQMEAKFGPIMQSISKCQDNEAVMAALKESMPQ